MPPLADPMLTAAAQRAPASAPLGADHQTMRRKALEMEGFFLSQMLQPMFKEISTEALFGGGLGEEMWRSLQVDEFGKAMARAGGIGLADAVLREMLTIQEQAGGTS